MPAGRALAFVAVVAAAILRATPAAQAPDGSVAAPFIAHTIDTGLSGGYQAIVTDVNGDGRPDVVALASGLKELRWYENPSWERHVLVTGISQPINAAAFDTDGDGIPEIALAHEFSNAYARSLGIVSILSHKGDPKSLWSMKEIDRVPTSHRLRFADIDGTGRKVLVNFPLIGPEAKAPDYRGRVSLLMYRPGKWTREVITDAEEGVVHGIVVTSWDGGRRESLLSGSFLGVHLLQYHARPDRLRQGSGESAAAPATAEGRAYDGDSGHWTRTLIARGDPADWPRSGSSDVMTGYVGGERFLATIEPWHGNEVVVYRRRGGTWRRHVIDESVVDAHTIVAGDFDGDGQDEIVVGERQGRRSVYLYRLTNAGEDAWAKQPIDDGGMAGAGCAVADLNADRRPDVVCIGTGTANLKWYDNAR
jgi:hypothetical protein